MMKIKEKEEYFDLIRCVSTIIVVCFHYSAALVEYKITGFNNYFLKFANGPWGLTAVTMFFMLSGAALFYNNSEQLEIKKYFIKRWKNIFPMFYLAWGFMYCIRVIKAKTFFWGGAPWKLILTLFGLDGYFLYLGKNYYILGEWFLGAIILLYLLFPFLRILINKYMCITTGLLSICYLICLNTHWFKIGTFRNLITCLLSFWIRMLFIKYKDRINRMWFIVAMMICLTLIFFKLNINQVISINILGYALFIVLMYNSKFIMKSIVIKRCVSVMSKYSYPIYLVHHVIITSVLVHFSKTYFGVAKGIVMLFIVFMVILTVAFVLFRLNSLIIILFNKLLQFLIQIKRHRIYSVI